MPGTAQSHHHKNIGGEANDDDVDHDLAAFMSSTRLGKSPDSRHRKGNKQVLEWDDDMETMQREKKAAEAMRGAPLYT